MADNTLLNAGTGGNTIATDDVSGVHYQRVKLTDGTADSATPINSGHGVAANALRVELPTDGTGVIATVGAVTAITNALPAGTNAIGKLAANTGVTIGAVEIAATQTLATVTTVGAVTAITNALPAGTNAIGKLAANSGVDIGDVDVTTVGTITPGTAATNLGKAEDAAHTSGDVGILALGVRRDADTTPVSADGDYHAPIFDANGYLKVNIKAGAGSGGTAIADGATFTRATTSITPAGAVVETSAPTLTNGQVAGLSQTTGGALRVAVASGGVAGVLEDAASAGAEEGVLMMGVRQDTLASSTSADGDYTYPKFSAAGAMYVTGGGGGTQYAEDAAHVSGDTGTMMLAVRSDAGGPLAGTTGDYSPLMTDALGRLAVSVQGAVGTFVDDAAFTPGTNSCVMMGGTFDNVSPDSVDEGDAGALRMSANRNLFVNLRDAAGNERGLNIDASGQLAVTLAAAQTLATVTNVGTIGTSVTPGVAAGNLGKAEDAAHASGDTGVAVWQVRTDTLAASSGTTGDYEAFHSDSLGALWTRDSSILADDSAFTPATSRVMPVGYTADDTATDSVDEGDIGASRMTLNRKVIHQPYESEANVWNYAAPAAGLVTTTAVTAKASAGAGLRNYITSIQVTNSHPTIGTEVQINDGAAGTVLHRGFAAPLSGYIVTLVVPLKGSVATLLEIKEATATATTGVLVNLQGYVGA